MAPTEEPQESAQPDKVSSLSPAGAQVIQEIAATGIRVSYDPNGGESPTLTTVVQPGGTYGPQPEATRHGHALAGWWTQPEGGEQVTADTPLLSQEDHTLYAHWEKQAVTAKVTYDGNGGRVKTRESQLALGAGEAFGKMPTPLREGYTFLGWFTQAQGGEQVTGEALFSGADTTLYAQWEYDPVAFWRFTLENRVQQVYLCQQAPIYFETVTQGVTAQYSALLSDTGSLNIAENREDDHVTDEWVLAKKPSAVVKQVASFDEADQVRRAMKERFPDQEIILVDSHVLDTWDVGAYTGLALAKHLYPDWFDDIDLDQVARELNITGTLIQFEEE